MSKLVRWNGGLRPLNVYVLRTEGLDLLPGEWEAKLTGSDTKVIVREADTEPVFSIRFPDGAA